MMANGIVLRASENLLSDENLKLLIPPKANAPQPRSWSSFHSAHAWMRVVE